MPVGRLWMRLEKLAKEQEAKEKQRLQEWEMGLYVQGRCSEHVSTAHDEMPVLPTEQKKKPNVAKIQEAKERRQTHDTEWFTTLRSPQHFAHFLSLPEAIFGPPPPEATETPEEKRDRQRIEARERRERLIQKLREHREQHGNHSLLGLRQDDGSRPVSH